MPCRPLLLLIPLLMAVNIPPFQVASQSSQTDFYPGAGSWWVIHVSATRHYESAGQSDYAGYATWTFDAYRNYTITSVDEGNHTQFNVEIVTKGVENYSRSQLAGKFLRDVAPMVQGSSRIDDYVMFVADRATDRYLRRTGPSYYLAYLGLPVEEFLDQSKLRLNATIPQPWLYVRESRDAIEPRSVDFVVSGHEQLSLAGKQVSVWRLSYAGISTGSFYACRYDYGVSYGCVSDFKFSAGTLQVEKLYDALFGILVGWSEKGSFEFKGITGSFVETIDASGELSSLNFDFELPKPAPAPRPNIDETLVVFTIVAALAGGLIITYRYAKNLWQRRSRASEVT